MADTSTPHATVWGLFAKEDGKWLLQWPVVESRKAVEAYMPLYAEDTEFLVLPMSTQPQTPPGWREALQFYAGRSHFGIADESAWDTVSGEPQNFWCDEAGTATVEDGTVAAMALRGTPIPDDDAMVEVDRIEAEHHGLDTATRVCFYEQDFYVLSNFSSFSVRWYGMVFPTSEHAYHWEKFRHEIEGENDNDRFQRVSLAESIRLAPSAHEAFKTAEHWKRMRRPDWDDVKVGIMRAILRAKVTQHEYVRRKLLATGDRELVENSWRDAYWGWGPNRDGKNMLGKLWMEVRCELRTAAAATSTTGEQHANQA